MDEVSSETKMEMWTILIFQSLILYLFSNFSTFKNKQSSNHFVLITNCRELLRACLVKSW
jgi:hypothetical protein